jgi:Gas vesicle protein G
VIIVDTLVIGGLRFVLRRLAEAVDAELNDVDAIREELLAAQMRLELGEITAEQFAGLERDLLTRLREIREPEAGDDGSPMRITGIEVDIADDVDDGADGPPRR